MTPADYDSWYDTPRGRWIGEREWALVRDALQLQAQDNVLDVGCGTGWFTRRAETIADRVVGLDIEPPSQTSDTATVAPSGRVRGQPQAASARHSVRADLDGETVRSSVGRHGKPTCPSCGSPAWPATSTRHR